jgi:hypothetical protein
VLPVAGGGRVRGAARCRTLLGVTGRTLSTVEIIATVETLTRRVEERFPSSNLGSFCKQLEEVSCEADETTAEIRKPLLSVRFGVAVTIVGLVVVLGWILGRLLMNASGSDFGEGIQSLEAALSSTFFLGAAMVFLFTLEFRLKRRRALRALHELRAMAHIVDMLQLTKDPLPLSPSIADGDTRSSPVRHMTAYELSRYLDYCSEALALIGKIGALYARDLMDPVVIGGVDGLQVQIDGLSQKIWHKMARVDRLVRDGTEPVPVG